MWKLVLASALSLCTACESSPAEAPDAAASAPDAATPTMDAGSCAVGRYLVDCTDPGGGGEMCLSDTKACGGYAPTSCASSCADTEHAVACADGTSPPGCHASAFVPSGTLFSCCPGT